MKVLNISKYHFNYRGGVEKEARRVSLQLSVKHQVDTICFGKENLTEIISKNERILTFKSTRILKKVDVSVQLISFILKNYEDYDVVWIHYPNILPIFPLLSRRWRNKIIILQYQNDIKVLPILYAFFKPFEKAILTKSSAIITSSPNYHKYSKVLKSFEEKIKPIPIRIPNVLNGINEIPMRNIDKITLVTVGRYTKYKGYEKLVELIKNENRFNLKIISSSIFPSTLKKEIEGATNIELLSNLNDTQLTTTLNTSHVFILSSISRNEGFGIVLLEALRLGIPICVNHLEGTGSEYITIPEKNGEYFNIEDKSSLIRALNKICDTNNYEDYCIRALKDFESRFSLNETKEFLSVLENIAIK